MCLETRTFAVLADFHEQSRGLFSRRPTATVIVAIQQCSYDVGHEAELLPLLQLSWFAAHEQSVRQTQLQNSASKCPDLGVPAEVAALR